MTYAENLNILNANFKLKENEMEKALNKMIKKEGNKYINKFSIKMMKFWQAYNEYIDLFTYCMKNNVDLNGISKDY